MSLYIIICLFAFIASGLTLYSGFGLGTILLPVFAFYFPMEVAIALTAIVHFLNNLFKLFLTGKHADWGVVLRFGLPSVFAALLGALALNYLGGFSEIWSYQCFDKLCAISPVKLVVAILLFFFALFDLVPTLARLQFDKKWLPLGGVLSGFFGGLSGHQGALRSVFLIRSGLNKEAFIASGVVIACMIDLTRLTVYANQILGDVGQLNLSLILAAVLSAFAGAYGGSLLVKKVTLKLVQLIVALMVMLFSIALGAGLV